MSASEFFMRKKPWLTDELYLFICLVRYSIIYEKVIKKSKKTELI